MERILKKYTTIPKHLYVERNADFQLKKIIEDMQRPGYVLVARQMGKTNLLINAKRTLESDQRLFVYVDLSNLYANERDCLRNIINCIIEYNYDIFYDTAIIIEKLRTKDYSPHNEYLRSLVSILESYTGDIVIILDEIDALRSVNYSDNIFAQIRSNYFSRINFEVLNRLTYVLSGVIEPTELIRDKNKSPFNIGDKIYLDDFTFEEHQTFIYKSKLTISAEISSEIFKWTKGNPRLTFDICSEIESLIVEGNKINVDSVKKIITRKYLTTYDVAPIDHIRELVKESKIIREAIKNIYLDRDNLINDETKSKLYLYGIINSKFSDKTKIKNPIIRESLNIEWLNSLDLENNFVSGLAKYLNAFYNDAINIFKSVIESSSDSIEVERSKYYTGLSYYSLDDYREAIRFFALEYNIEEIRRDSLAYYGISLLKLGDKQGESILEQIVLSEKYSVSYFDAVINLAQYSVDEEKALALYEKIITYSEVSVSSGDSILNFKILAYYYQSLIYVNRNDLETAIDKTNKAIELASSEDKATLLQIKINLKDKIKKEASEDRHELVRFIIQQNLTLNRGDKFQLRLDETVFMQILNAVFNEHDINPFLDLIDYMSNNIFRNFTEALDFVIQSVQIENGKIREILTFLKSSYTFHLSTNQHIEVLRLLIGSEPGDSSFINIFDEYFDIIESNKNYKLLELDFAVLLPAIQKFTSNRALGKVIIVSDLIEARIRDLDDIDSKQFLSAALFLKTMALHNLGDKNGAYLAANQTIAIINSIEISPKRNVDLTTLKMMKSSLLQISAITKLNFQGNRLVKNEIVKVKYLATGKIRQAKFKHIENDLASGRCIIFDN